ncbi:MAG TPA: hypothetical protein VFK30_11780, partial [Anaerolineae bacterium]|nr:hypothetical protein [Anaerolineae bacterium]
LADLGDTQSARERLRLAAAKAEQANDQNCLFAIYQSVARLELWSQNFSEAAQWLEAAPVPNELACFGQVARPPSG